MQNGNPAFRNASREEISHIFTPFSPYCLLSVAKLSRDAGVSYANETPIVCLRNRPRLAPKKRHGRNLHGHGCRECNPRQGVPRKPYNRAATKRWPID